MLSINHSSPAFMTQGSATGCNLSDIDRALAHAFNGVSDGLIDLKADGIGETLKLIFGRPCDKDHVPIRFVQYMANQQFPPALMRDRLGLPQLRLLTAFYTGLWQGNAFQENGDFDFDGLISFVGHYLAESDDWTINCLASEVGKCHFDAIKRFGPPKDGTDANTLLSICDSVGGEIALPGPMSALFAAGGRYRGLYLANVSLAGTEMTNVHLTESNLGGADFSFVVFDRVRLQKCCIEGARFNRARLNAVDIDTSNVQNAIFTKCVIRGGHWTDSHFNHAGFHDTGIDGLTSVACYFNATRFNGPPRVAPRLGPALFKNVVIRRSQLNAAVFSSVVAAGLSLNTCTCHGATFIDNLFSESSFTASANGALFERNQFRSCTFRGMDAKESRWLDVHFDAFCTFINANFSDSTWRFGAFDSQGFDGIHFARAKLRDVHFARIGGQANFVKAVFDGATLNRVIFNQCVFPHAKFLAARLTGSRFEACDLRGAQFGGAAGLDLVSAVGANNITRVSLVGVTGALADWTLAVLATPDGRDRMLNRLREPDCMMAKIMRVKNLAIRVDWVVAIVEFLERCHPGALDADRAMLSAMLTLADHPHAVMLESRARLEEHINTLLIRQLPQLSGTGLSSTHEALWTIQAADRIGALVNDLADVAQWQQMRPLIASLFALHDQKLIQLGEQTLAGLRHAREASAPTTQADAV